MHPHPQHALPRLPHLFHHNNGTPPQTINTVAEVLTVFLGRDPMKFVSNLSFAMLAICVMCSPTEAAVTEYTNKSSWQTAVGNNYTTIDFLGYPNTTFITNQYASLGVIFTDGNDSIWHTPSYVIDGAGLQG